MADEQYQAYLNSLSNAPQLGELPVEAPSSTSYDDYIQGLSNGTLRPSNTGNQIGAGVDMGQALLWESASQVAHLLGFSGTEAQKYFEEQANAEMVAANQVPALNLWDHVQRGFGTLGVGAVPVLAAGAVGAPFGVGAAGMAAAGTLLSAGMNLGDLSTKAKEEDPNFRADWEDVGVAGALGAAELIPAARVYKSLSAVKPALGETFRAALGNSVPGALGTIGTAGLVEAGQDFATGVQALRSTDTEITDAKIDALVDSAIMEATVGAIVAGPIGAINAGTETVSRMRPDRVEIFRDENGDLQATYNAPIQDAATDPSMLSKVWSRTVGRITDRMELDLGQLSNFHTELKEHLVQNKTERAAMRAAGRDTKTQDITEQTKTADVKRGAEGFFRATPEAQDAALQAKSKGLKSVEDPEVNKALQGIWQMEENVRNLIPKGMGIRLRGATYVPFDPDVDRILKDPLAFEEDIITSMEIEDSVGEEKAREKIKGYVDNLRRNGQYVPDNQSANKIADNVKLTYGKWAKAGSKKARRNWAAAMNKSVVNDGAIASKANPLEQFRFLEDAPDEALQRWSAAKSARDVYESHAKRIGVRLAHVDKWGANNEKYWEAWTKIIKEATEKDIPIDPLTLEKADDILNAIQRIPTKRVRVDTKQVMENVRAFFNVTKLPLAIIPSLAESLFVFNEFGVPTAFKKGADVAFNEAKRSLTGLDPNPEYQRLLDDLSMSMHEASSIMMSRVADETFNPKIIEAKFFNLILLPQFTEFLRMTAAFGAEKQILELAQMFENGTRGEQQLAVQKLYEAGLNPGEVLRWTQDPDKFDTEYYRDQIRPATLALAEDVVVNPSPSKKPLWHSDERLMLLAHMKSFATTFTNGMMRTWWDRMTTGTTSERLYYATKIFPLVATFVGMQVALAGLREYIKTGDTENWDENTIWQHTLQGASYLGGVGMGLESAHMSGWGMSPVESLLGPAVGEGADVAQMLGRVMADPTSFMDEVIKMGIDQIPSMPLSGPIKEMLEEAFGAQ